jgi:putrescine transport system ATP-binding protein
MQAGRLEQVAQPRLLYEEPASRWIAEFVGDINLFEGEVSAREPHRLTIATRDAGDLIATEPQRPLVGSNVCVAIRPEKIRLAHRLATDAATAPAVNRITGVIADANYLGGTTIYKVKLDSGPVVRAAVANTARLDVHGYGIGQRVLAWFTPNDCVVLDR